MPASAAVPDDRTLLITRVFDAPRALVFRAWTDPAQFVRWMGPRSHPAVKVEQDVRPGGRWRGCLRPTEGGADLWQGGTYREVVANEKLVFTFVWDSRPGLVGVEMLITIQFHDHAGGKTRMEFRQEFLPSRDERVGHNRGWSSCFERLDELLASAQA